MISILKTYLGNMLKNPYVYYFAIFISGSSFRSWFDANSHTMCVVVAANAILLAALAHKWRNNGKG